MIDFTMEFVADKIKPIQTIKMAMSWSSQVIKTQLYILYLSKKSELSRGVQLVYHLR